ncbi:hypothetical protein AAG570_006486 [Ranatra chinensis]|uniref:2-oxoglutarate dehydrogenase E1 component/KDG C-terminal domain-containing protein n=1 Tax=Ranatra chinensis TaxID=642074 RepID=A0ABD0YU49_9HEMI
MSLVIWESVPGDLTSRVLRITDRFLSRGQKIWLRQCGIVIVLAHGLNGLEEAFWDSKPAAFLQQCFLESAYWRAQTMVERLRMCNWVIVNVTTPANYFHLLRRHSKVNFRKPVVLFTHRKIFNNPKLISDLSEFVEGTSFQTYIPDQNLKDYSNIVRVLFCCGTIYFDLLEERAARKLENSVAICRLEQFYPFPFKELRADVVKYPKETQLFWVQLESFNLGWWSQVQERFDISMTGNPLMMETRVERTIGYIGPPRTAPAFYPPTSQQIYRQA